MSAPRKRKLEMDTPAPDLASKPSGETPSVNPHTARMYSQQYYDILSKRQGAGTVPSVPWNAALTAQLMCSCASPPSITSQKSTWSMAEFFCRTPGVASQVGLHHHGPAAPNHHPGRRNWFRQDHTNTSIHVGNRLQCSRPDGSLYTASACRSNVCS